MEQLTAGLLGIKTKKFSFAGCGPVSRLMDLDVGRPRTHPKSVRTLVQAMMMREFFGGAFLHRMIGLDCSIGTCPADALGQLHVSELQRSAWGIAKA